MKHLLLIGLLFFSLNTHATIKRLIQVDQKLWRGSQPENAEDWAKLKALGIRTVIDLRHTDSQFRDEELQANLRGMIDLHYPMNPFLFQSDEKMKELNHILSDKSYLPIFVHCAAGKDRTGLVIGLYRTHQQHWPKDKAYQEMKQIGFNPIYLPLKIFFNQHWQTF